MANPARFEAVETESGEWFWRLRARNGEVLGHSEMYPDEATAHDGIEAARRAADAEGGSEVHVFYRADHPEQPNSPAEDGAEDVEHRPLTPRIDP